jgi:lipopolysaccharide export system permease protein
MIFEKAIRRDLANLSGVVFATLFTIMVTTTLIRMLGRAAGGSVDTASLLPLIAFASINLLPILLVLTVYISVLMSITRAYRDSEMVIWFSSGRSLAAWVRPVMRFGLPVLLVVLVTAFEGAPWANRQTSEYTRRFEQREDVSQVAAGQFRESASADRVFFVEALSEDQTSVRNVFVTQQRGEQLIIVAAAGGRIETEADGDRFLVLERGRRYDGERSGPAFRLMEFERYGLRMEPRASRARDDSSKIKSTMELIESWSPRDRAELLWRIGIPVSLIVLSLLAIPLSSLNPRVGRSVNLFVAVLVYVVYNNLISVSQAWVAQERIGFVTGVLSVHAMFLLGVAVLFWRRITLPDLRIFRRRARA